MDSIRESSFILVGKRTAANVVDFGEAMAVPLVVTSLLLLATTGVLWMVGNHGGFGAAVCAVQPGIGMVAVGGAAIPWAVIALVAVVTIVIWILVIVLALCMLGVLASGG